MKKIDSDDFRVRPGKKVDLSKWPTEVKSVCDSKDEYETLLTEHIRKMSEQQNRLYADDTYALLLIFQAMDAAGKDSAIKHVMSGVNPQGCQVYSFKHPSAEDLDHDFLWNASRKLPERGRIGIFNRSYYEEVLIVRVHKEILGAERLPKDLLQDKSIWRDRYDSIVNLESHLHRNGTQTVKFFLHLSREEQRKRFLKRIDEPDKNWKFNIEDVKERQSWDRYMKAYEECLSATSTKHAPWYIVPADDKAATRLIVSRIILDTFKRLKLRYPQLSPQRLRELQNSRKLLAKER